MSLASSDRLTRQEHAGAVTLVLPDPSFALVRFVISIRLGAVLDPPAEQGAMRLMFELLLRGTEKRPRQAFNQVLEALGAQVDVSVGHDVALCRGVTLRRHLPRVWALVCEALTEPAFAVEEIERLKQECREELLGERDDDDAVAEIFLRRALYGDHRLGQAPGGSTAQLDRLGRGAVQAAFERFGAQDLLIGWAGDVTPAQAHDYSEALLAARSHRPCAAAHLAPPPPILAGPRLLLVDKPDRTQVQLRLAALGPRAPQRDCEAFWLGALAFGGTFTSPFTREVRDVRGWSYVAQADYRRQSRLAAPVTLRCAPGLADAAACLQLCVELFGDLAAGRLDDPLIDAARDYALNRYPFEVATAFDMLGAAMAQELCGLPPSHLFALPERLSQTPAAAARTALAAHLQATNYVAVAVAPKSELLAALRQQLGYDFPIDVVDFRADI